MRMRLAKIVLWMEKMSKPFRSNRELVVGTRMSSDKFMQRLEVRMVEIGRVATDVPQRTPHKPFRMLWVSVDWLTT